MSTLITSYYLNRFGKVPEVSMKNAAQWREVAWKTTISRASCLPNALAISALAEGIIDSKHNQRLGGNHSFYVWFIHSTVQLPDSKRALPFKV